MDNCLWIEPTSNSISQKENLLEQFHPSPGISIGNWSYIAFPHLFWIRWKRNGKINCSLEACERLGRSGFNGICVGTEDINCILHSINFWRSIWTNRRFGIAGTILVSSSIWDYKEFRCGICSGLITGKNMDNAQQSR